MLLWLNYCKALFMGLLSKTTKNQQLVQNCGSSILPFWNCYIGCQSVSKFESRCWLWLLLNHNLGHTYLKDYLLSYIFLLPTMVTRLSSVGYLTTRSIWHWPDPGSFLSGLSSVECAPLRGDKGPQRDLQEVLTRLLVCQSFWGVF